MQGYSSAAAAMVLVILDLMVARPAARSNVDASGRIGFAFGR
jgi:hypothetical protein